MSGRRGAKPPDYRVNLRLDYELDGDLIAWMEAQPRGALSQAIREVLRRGLEAEGQSEPGAPDYESIRQIVADELASALAGLLWQAPPLADEVAESSDIESQFGTKLDQMMGGLAANSDLSEDEFE